MCPPSIFFCLREVPRAALLHPLMSSMARIFFLIIAAAAVAFAQEPPAADPSPSPSPSASPDAVAAQPVEAPAAVSTPDAAASAPAPELQPAAPEATPPPASPDAAAPEASPSPTPDVIPMEGAPLDTQSLAPALPERAPDAAMPDAAFTDPNALIPDQGPPALPKAVENVSAKRRGEGVRYYEVRVEADKDPNVLEMWKKSESATTDEDKRAALREYYRLLFRKMVSIDKSLEDKCRVMENAYIRRLAQQRLEPTIPLNPPPTPSPLGQ